MLPAWMSEKINRLKSEKELKEKQLVESLKLCKNLRFEIEKTRKEISAAWSVAYKNGWV